MRIRQPSVRGDGVLRDDDGGVLAPGEGVAIRFASRDRVAVRASAPADPRCFESRLVASGEVVPAGLLLLDPERLEPISKESVLLLRGMLELA